MQPYWGGADEYYALDIIGFDDLSDNVAMLDELVSLFRNRSNVPDEDALSATKPNLRSYAFPRHILTDEILEKSLSNKRIEEIKALLMGKKAVQDGEIHIQYIAPYSNMENDFPKRLDYVYSQSVMEYIENLEDTYKIMGKCLAEGGYMSHQIDLSSQGLLKYWNGHWGCSQRLWKSLIAKCTYYINRQPASAHLNAVRNAGLALSFIEKTDGAPEGRNYPVQCMSYERLSNEFKGMSEEDFNTSGLFFVAKKGGDK